MSIYQGMHQTPSSDRPDMQDVEDSPVLREHDKPAIPENVRWLYNFAANTARALGKGDKIDKIEEGRQDKREKRLNLMQAIQKSRQAQQDLTKEWDYKERQLEETMRVHKASEAQGERTQAINEGYLAEQRRHNLARESMGGAFSFSDRKAMREAVKDRKSAIRALKEIDNLEEIVNKLDTGPVKGNLKELTGSFIPGVKTDLDNTLEVATDNIIMDLHQSMKNIPRSEGFIKMLQQTKPSLRNTRKGNMESIRIMREKALDVLRYNEDILGAGEGSYAHPEPSGETEDLSKLSNEQLEAIAGGR